MASNRSGSGGASRWGSMRSREEERGYSIYNNDRDRRSREDDRYYGHRDDEYYGRGYEDSSRDERSRHSDYRDYDRSRYGRGYDDEYRRSSDDDEGRYRGYRRGNNGYDEEKSWSRDEREWKCEECGIDNPRFDDRCARCGHHPGETPQRRTQSPADEPEEPKQQDVPTWPPPFESRGAAYDFHAASGMFFEPISDYFYDPKTKLYYSNKQKIYYTYRPDQDPPFCALESQSVTGESTSSGKATVAVKPQDKKIAISLTTKVLPGETTKKAKAHKTAKKVKAPPPEPKKKDAANIEVWAERGKETREEAARNQPMTTTNQPVCLLCRRKFASIEKLKKHEELSNLHKENLEKKRKEDEAKKASEAEYRDRAMERRIMHGPEAASLPGVPRDLDASSNTARTAAPVRPEDSLGDQNIGNQMLKKIGWTSGSTLGRDRGGQDAVQNTLVKDWEKIESLAANGQQAGPSSRERGIGN